MPLVSIIVPVYNTEQYLDKCIKSLVSQTLKDIEIILVNDGSSDNSPAICDAWAEKDNRIKVIHKENGGLSSARNAALDVCNGEYIGFVDSDDYVESAMFEELYHSAKKYDSDVSLCAHFQLSRSKATECLLPFKGELYRKEEIKDNFILPLIGYDENAIIPTLEGFAWRQIFRKDTISDIRFKSEKDFFAEDVVFDLEVYPLCNSISVVNKPLYYYVFNENSLSNKYRRNVWQKLSNLLEVKKRVVEICGKTSSAKQRLLNETIKFIGFTVLNLKKAGSDISNKEIKEELISIRTDKNTEILFKTQKIHTEKKTKILIFLLKYRIYNPIVFAIRK